MTSMLAPPLSSSTPAKLGPGSVPESLARSQGAVPARVAATAAFAILVFRYLAMDEVAVRSGPGALTRVRIGPSTRVSEILEQIAAVSAGERCTLSWSEAAEGGAALSLTFELPSLAIDRERSTQRNLIACADPMRAIERHFRAVLAAVRSRRFMAVADVPLLGAAERSLVLDVMSRAETKLALLDPGCLHELFETQAKLRPHAIAVEDGDRALTYRALDRRADRLASGLRAAGIAPGSFVAFRLPRSLEVYVAMLGILKSGAAYLPIDPESPRDRVELMIRDCEVAALIGPPPRRDESEWPCMSIDLDDLDGTLPEGPPLRVRAPTPDDVCYVIYTSGSTGRPKGVAIEHRSARHLALAEQELFGVHRDDRVLQGFSVAFDAAVEEIWLAFAAGGTLVVAHKHALLGDVAGFLSRARISVLSTVPTLLQTLEGDLPGVRVLILGGEACPQDLVARFATPERPLFNTYGPTEATVIATCARLGPGAPVTLGRPIPNYRSYVLDARGNPLPVGVTGEICLGGVGLARGYVNNRALTESKFIESRVAGRRLYRTGDLGRFRESGELEFLGRIDDQVKLRGHRIELGEVEAALVRCAGIAQAAVVLREDTPGDARLVGYVVPRVGAQPAHGEWERTLKEQLRTSLAPYMVPSAIVTLPSLPVLESGKINRKSLPPPLIPVAAEASLPLPSEGREAALRRAWGSLFGVQDVGSDAHFFDDLGGHSLLAAQVVSSLRRSPAFASLSVLDVYRHPTAAQLARALGALDRAADLPAEHPPAKARAENTTAFRLCGGAQAIAAYGLFALHGAQWLAPFLAFAWLRHEAFGVGAALVSMLAVTIAARPLMLLVAIATKWLVIGRYRAGRFPLFGGYHFRWWLVDRVLAMAPLDELVGTPLLPWFYRAMGARVGENVFIGSAKAPAFDLLDIGNDVTVGQDATLSAHAIEDGELVLGPISIADGSTLGARSHVASDARIEADAHLGSLSFLARGVTLPRGESWLGSPARPNGRPPSSPLVRPSRRRRALFGVVYGALCCVSPALALAAMVPAFVLLGHFERAWGGLWYLLLTPLAAASVALLLCLEVAALKWLVVGRVTPGTHALFSATRVRAWLFERAMATTQSVLGALYATLYLDPWLRLLGVKLGAQAEISTAGDLVPDLVEVGEGAFVADCVSLGAARIERGVVTLASTRIGRRSFVGNSAVVACGSTVEDDALVGCATMAPPCVERGSTCVGSPAISLPRQKGSGLSEERTYRPTGSLVARRLAIELTRITLPTAALFALTCLLVHALLALAQRSLPAALLAMPALVAAAGLAAACLVIALKWLLVGRYRATSAPLWSTLVWRAELVTALQENLADPLFNEPLLGTPLVGWFFRALGARVGKRVYFGTTQLTEYDLVEIGDDVCLDEDATLQTHLFEDRVMKMGAVRLDARTSVGADAIVLYDTRMESGASLGPLSLLMKGEVLPAETRWAGIPAAAAAPFSREPSRFAEGHRSHRQRHDHHTHEENAPCVTSS